MLREPVRSQAADYPGDGTALLLAVLVTAPLALRDRHPLAAWRMSFAGLAVLSAEPVAGRHRVHRRRGVRRAHVRLHGDGPLRAAHHPGRRDPVLPGVGSWTRSRRSWRRCCCWCRWRRRAAGPATSSRGSPSRSSATGRRTRVLEERPAHRPRAARRRRPPHVGDHHPGGGRAATGSTGAAGRLAESFADIGASALERSTEMRRVLGVLRDRGRAPRRAPQPGPRPARRAGRQRRAAGLTRRRTSTGGGRGPLPPGVEPVRVPDRAGGAEQRVRHAPGAPSRVADRRCGPAASS